MGPLGRTTALRPFAGRRTWADEADDTSIKEVAAHPITHDLSYATVRDYCDSTDRFPKLASHNQDLKDTQRPWAVKTLARLLPRGAKLLEIGGGEPLAANALVEMGYDVTLCDPFDGSGNGPTNFESLRAAYPNVKFLRSLFTTEVAHRMVGQLDAVFSISVLEHVHSPALEDLFEAIRLALRPGGDSLHAVDHILEGQRSEDHEAHMAKVCLGQAVVVGAPLEAGQAAEIVAELMGRAKRDLETFIMSPVGYNRWRGQTPYEQYPFHKVISMQTIVRKDAH